MKQICFYLENYYEGGVDTFIIQLINALPINKYQITLLCNKSHAGVTALQNKITHPNAKVELFDMYMHNDLVKKFFKGNLSILKKFFSGLIYILLIPYYILFGYHKLKLKRFDSMIVINGGYPAGLSSRCIAISWYVFSKKKSIMNFHNMAIKSNLILRPFDTFIDKLLVRSISNFLSVSKVCSESLRIRTPFKSLKNIHYIYNGIDSNIISPCFDIRKELNINRDIHIIMMLASYEERKGHKFILNVFNKILDKVSNVHLVFLGYGSNREKMNVRNYIDELSLDEKVTMLGFKSNAMEYLTQSDLILIGSQQFESFGLTAIEAMKYKKVVLSTNVGGLKEVIKDGEGGFLFEKDDVDGMAQKAVNLLLDSNQRKQQGELGFNRYKNNFTVKEMVDQYVKFIDIL